MSVWDWTVSISVAVPIGIALGLSFAMVKTLTDRLNTLCLHHDLLATRVETLECLPAADTLPDQMRVLYEQNNHQGHRLNGHQRDIREIDERVEKLEQPLIVGYVPPSEGPVAINNAVEETARDTDEQ